MGHRSLLMVMVWVWYKFEGKCWALLESGEQQRSKSAQHTGRHITDRSIRVNFGLEFTLREDD